MLAFEPRRTLFDLRLPLPLASVRIHPTFWPVAFLLGATEHAWGWQRVLTVVGVAFVAVYIHGLGQVLMGRCFGSSGRIVATGFGSHGIADPPIELGSARLLVNLAGPTAGFAVLLVVFGVVLAFDSRMAWEQLYWFFSDCGIPIRIEIEMPFGAEPFIEVVLRYLFLISFGWSIWSLLPIWPLDGGRILFEVCETRSGYSGAIGSMMISATVALMAVAFTLVSLRNDPGLTLSGRWQFGAIWFAMLLIHNFFMMEVVRRQRSRYEALHDDPIEAVADEA